MAFTPTEPTKVDVPVAATEEREIDTYHFESLAFDLSANRPDQNRVVVSWIEGYVAADKLFYQTRRNSHTISGDTFNAAAMQMSDGTKSHWDNIKHALWAVLIAEGVVSGTVS